jgi:acyl-CoA thioesterase-2
LHAYFLRPGNVDQPLQITVDRVRDGRSFSTREAVAEQQGKALFRMLVSFQVPARTPEYAGRTMPQVPSPERVTFSYDDFTLQQTGASDWHGSARPMDIRYVNPPTAPRGQPVTESQLMWMRIPERLPDDPGVHRAALGNLSDSTLVDHVMLPLGLRWQDDDFEGASLDHAMWFHRFARADDWLLFEQSVEATGAGRGLASGRFFTASGELVATCLQEGLMRWTAP